MKDRTRLGIVGDSPTCDSGYGKIIREIFSRISLSNQFELSQHGWWYRGSSHVKPRWPIMKTATDPKGLFVAKDKFGEETFDNYYERYKPEIVWSTGDPWMVGHIQKSKHRSKFRHIYYMPIDYEYMTTYIHSMIKNIDTIVGYTEFGANTYEKNTGKKITHIPPGVDHNVFKPYDNRIEWKKQGFGLEDQQMLVGFFSRNNNRKNLGVLLRALSICINKHGNENIYVYLHCAKNGDAGPGIDAMIEEFGLTGHVFWADRLLRPGQGVSETELAVSMNICDICVLPSLREGFGMTGIESMACGRKTYVTKCTGMLEYGVNFLDPITVLRESEPMQAVDGYVVDADYLAGIILSEYEKKHKLQGPDLESWNATKGFSWDEQAKKWYDILNQEKQNIFKGKKWQILNAI